MGLKTLTWHQLTEEANRQKNHSISSSEKNHPRFPRIWKSHFRYVWTLHWAGMWIASLWKRIIFLMNFISACQAGNSCKSPNKQHVPTNPQLSFGFFYLTAMEFIKTSSWQYKVLSHALLKREKLKPITPEQAGKKMTVASKPSGEPR